MLSQVERKFDTDTTYTSRYIDKTTRQEMLDEMSTGNPKRWSTLGKHLGLKENIGEEGHLALSGSSTKNGPHEKESDSDEVDKKHNNKPRYQGLPDWQPPGINGPPGAERPDLQFEPPDADKIPDGMIPPGYTFAAGSAAEAYIEAGKTWRPGRPDRPGKRPNKLIPQTKYNTKKTRRTKRPDNGDKLKEGLNRLEDVTAFLYGNYTKKNTTRWWWPIEYGWEIDKVWYL